MNGGTRAGGGAAVKNGTTGGGAASSSMPSARDASTQGANTAARRTRRAIHISRRHHER
jgi:hypothetical protein